jgi:hypothetical protein
MSAYVRIPTAMTEREVLVEAIRQCKFTVQTVGDKITVPNIMVYGYMLTFEPSDKGFIAAGMDSFRVQRWMGHASVTTTQLYFGLAGVGLTDLRDSLEPRTPASLRLVA